MCSISGFSEDLTPVRQLDRVHPRILVADSAKGVELEEARAELLLDEALGRRTDGALELADGRRLETDRGRLAPREPPHGRYLRCLAPKRNPKGVQSKAARSVGASARTRTGMALWRPMPERGSKSRSVRSEEHTSELQSHHELVCRLLLEKKKQIGSCVSVGVVPGSTNVMTRVRVDLLATSLDLGGDAGGSDRTMAALVSDVEATDWCDLP